jgi:hypothetical protein
MFTPSLPHLHFSDTCSLINIGSNGSTKFLESLLSLIPFQRAGPALVLECYGVNFITPKLMKIRWSSLFLGLLHLTSKSS